MGWLADESLPYVPLNGWVTGWLGQTDGGWARTLADLVTPVDGPLRLATLGLELGAVVAVVHHRLFRLWFPAVIAFHVVNFALFGFWFLGWIVVEVGLSIVLWRTELADWVAANATPARGALVAAAVAVAGAALFHPPGLAWFDTPLAYGVEVEAVGTSGKRYRVPISSFSPFEQELAFTRVQLGSTRRLVGA